MSACVHQDCLEFAEREPLLSERMQKARVIAHYMGVGFMGGEYWMLGGITPVTRPQLERLLKDRESRLCPSSR